MPVPVAAERVRGTMPIQTATSRYSQINGFPRHPPPSVSTAVRGSSISSRSAGIHRQDMPANRELSLNFSDDVSQLGRVLISFDPEADAGEGDCGEEVSCKLVMAGRDASEVFELLKKRSTRLRWR